MDNNLIFLNHKMNTPTMVNVKRFDLQCQKICFPSKKNSSSDHEQTDSSSSLHNQKSSPNISNINLLKPEIIHNCLNRKLNLLNEKRVNEHDHTQIQETMDSPQSNSLDKSIKHELIHFLTTPLEENIWLRGRIISSKEKNNHILRYYIALSDKAPEILVMTAKKIKRNQYEIYANNPEKNTTTLIGKLSTNLFSNAFKLTSPTEAIIEKIKYDMNLFGLTGPLKLKVKTDLQKDFNQQKVFTNKKPNYSIRYNCYVLNYINRRIKSSVKNFQLISYDDNNNDNNTLQDNNIILQFGEINNCTFIIDFKCPFSPFQVFAIGISSIRKKKFCE